MGPIHWPPTSTTLAVADRRRFEAPADPVARLDAPAAAAGGCSARAAARPASPAPTTTTSASRAGLSLDRRRSGTLDTLPVAGGRVEAPTGLPGPATLSANLTSRMASRREEKEQRRRERLERERTQLEDARKRRLYAIVAGGVLVVAAIVAIVVAVAAGGGGGLGHRVRLRQEGEEHSSSAAAEDQRPESGGHGRRMRAPEPADRGPDPRHQQGQVPHQPAHLGQPLPDPATDGVYTKTPPFTHLVHTLEHGRVEIQYAPNLAPRRVAQLGGLFNESTAYMVLFPNGSMPYKVAVTAWGHLAGCKKVNDETFDVIRAFKQRYLGQAPEPLETQPTNF